MMEDAKCGRINCISVKDLSGLQGTIWSRIYLEKIFPFLVSVLLRSMTVLDSGRGDFPRRTNYRIKKPGKRLLFKRYIE